MKKLTTEEIKTELKAIESLVCRLSMRMLDDDPVRAKQLIGVGRDLLSIYESY